MAHNVLESGPFFKAPPFCVNTSAMTLAYPCAQCLVKKWERHPLRLSEGGGVYPDSQSKNAAPTEPGAGGAAALYWRHVTLLVEA